MNLPSEPDILPTDSEATAEAILYASIYNELTRMLVSPPECRHRARTAVEDFRDSRLMVKLSQGMRQ